MDRGHDPTAGGFALARPPAPGLKRRLAALAGGAGLYLAVLVGAVEGLGIAPPQGAVLAFPAGLAAHDALSPRRPAAPYAGAAPLGAASGALFAFLTARPEAFEDTESRP
ncbi:MAG: hypothetical protein ACK44W_18120 [Planctomycetota bacterium]